jgi:beta-galactosidase
LDGQEVFTGETPINFGYLSFPLKHVRGSRLRIQLNGPVQERVPARRAAGITGEVNAIPAGVIPDRTDGTLSVVEVEIYKLAQN